MVDWGSGYQLVDLLPNRERSAAKVWSSFCRTWIRYFSCPSVVIIDEGNEFAGVFSMSLGQLGCMHHTTDSKSPWQWNRGGFSPIQRVLGYQPELPQSLIEDDKAAM
eukprot:3552057-Amphidinium_carterae.1